LKIIEIHPHKLKIYGFSFKKYINTIYGEKKSDKYILQLLLEGHSSSIKINSACFGKSREFDVIIGMDIIEHGLFVLDKGKFSFSIKQLK
jgi:hypothetical protein